MMIAMHACTLVHEDFTRLSKCVHMRRYALTLCESNNQGANQFIARAKSAKNTRRIQLPHFSYLSLSKTFAILSAVCFS